MANQSRTVLLDTSVRSRALTAHGTTTKVPGFNNPLLLIQARPAGGPKKKWLREQTECIPTIARLAREGALALHTYDELTLEAWRSSESFPAFPFGDLFQGVNFNDVPAAIRRSLFFQGDAKAHATGAALSDFAKFLLELEDPAKLVQVPALRSRLTPFERSNLKSLDRFKELCRPLAEKHLRDAFHLWTGEVNGLSYFLTLDRKFVRAAAQNKEDALPCQPIAPSDLLDTLGVRQRDPLPLEYGRRYTMFGVLYD